MNANLIFVRHGYGCHNAISSLVRNDILTLDSGRQLLSNEYSGNTEFNISPLKDPVLTNVGVEASVYNGCVIKQLLNKISKKYNNPKLDFKNIDIIGCSPLIRCMETAYYMTRKWSNPPSVIYVFPLLREIDESSDDIYSEKSRRIMDVTPSYNMKTITEQKEYLKSIGILDYFDFTFVEIFNKEREEPGNIETFSVWFGKFFIPYYNIKENIKTKNKTVNTFIVTHAGVLKHFTNEGFVNNSGFILNTTYKFNEDSLNGVFKFNKYISLNKYLNDSDFFSYYNKSSYNKIEYYCPSNRCDSLCSIAKGQQSTLKSVGLSCNEINKTNES